jgi:hypothetical protein
MRFKYLYVRPFWRPQSQNINLAIFPVVYFSTDRAINGVVLSLYNIHCQSTVKHFRRTFRRKSVKAFFSCEVTRTYTHVQANIVRVVYNELKLGSQSPLRQRKYITIFLVVAKT